jgi:hypothetical protein
MISSSEKFQHESILFEGIAPGEKQAVNDFAE